MNLIATTIRLLCAAMLAPAVAHAQETAKGSADAGRTFANAVCAECHSIERGAKSSPNIKAPPFSAMIKSVKLTPDQIEGWLTSSHTFMPDFSVPADKRADIIAYIESLALKP